MKTITFIATALFITFSLVSGAQIEIYQGVDPVELVEMIAGPDVIFDNAQYTGANVARGSFSNGEYTGQVFNYGVFLTSGAGYIISGPNSSCSSGVNNGLPGDATLTGISGVTTYDAAVLQFDIIVPADTFKLNYIFGSEEYNDYVGSTFNDVFAILIFGPNPAGGFYSNFNIATLPGQPEEIVSINNVNNGYAPCNVVPTGPCTNCELFSDNTNGSYLEYDGLTTPLTALAPVIPNEFYHIKIAIADAGDHIFDSGLFIEGYCTSDFESFSFLAEDNPQLTEDVTGTISGDSVLLTMPQGTDVTALVADFDMMSCTKAYVNGIQQFSGASILDFTEPVVYTLKGSQDKEWIVVVDILTDVKNPVFSDVKIFPNPANGKFRISNVKGCDIKIVNAVGKVVRDYGTIEQSGINVDELNPGFYLVELKKDGFVETRKIVMK